MSEIKLEQRKVCIIFFVKLTGNFKNQQNLIYLQNEKFPSNSVKILKIFFSKPVHLLRPRLRGYCYGAEDVKNANVKMVANECSLYHRSLSNA